MMENQEVQELPKKSPLYVFKKKEVTICMIVDAVFLLLPAIVVALTYIYSYMSYMAIEDKSHVDMGPQFMMVFILAPFFPISFGAPLILFYRKLWKRPISKMKACWIILIPFIPALLSLPIWVFNVFVVFFGPFLLVLLLGSYNAFFSYAASKFLDEKIC